MGTKDYPGTTWCPCNWLPYMAPLLFQSGWVGLTLLVPVAVDLLIWEVFAR